MGLDRKITRRAARRLYEKFSAMWRRDARLSGRYGKPRTGKPKFADWWAMHLKEIAQAQESTPEDVREFIGDPWDDPGTDVDVQPEPQRGVLTVPISGDDE